MLYKDLYACDLSLALSGGAIEAIDKPYCMACIYSALRTIHEFGLQHRYINANSIYVTTTGVPKVSILFAMIFFYILLLCLLKSLCGFVSLATFLFMIFRHHEPDFPHF